MRTTQSFQSNGREICVEIFEPEALTKQPVASIVIAHGTNGLSSWHNEGSKIRRFAQEMACAGVRALVPHYLQSTFKANLTESETVTSAVFATLGPNRDTWAHVLSDARRFANALPDASGQCALAGFSLGGNLAIVEAQFAAAESFQAIVDFYGPMGMLGLGFAFNLAQLPPLQIHHGASDSLVPPGESWDLHAALLRSGKYPSVDFDLTWYAREGHGFLNRQAVANTVAFLKRAFNRSNVQPSRIPTVDCRSSKLDWDLAP